jgi:hypothetical protein
MRLDGGSLRHFAGMAMEAAEATSRRLGYRGAAGARKEAR